MENEKYYAIIISFNPDIEKVRNTVYNLKKQGFYVTIIDNHSYNVEKVKEIAVDHIQVEDTNLGIAAALNIGMSIAIENGATWILALDQDSEVDPNLLKQYRKYIYVFEDAGALCPKMVKRNESMKETNEDVDIVERCPTSGFFIKAEIWKKVGRYNEWMFIDYVDYDLCIRLKIAGYKIYRINTTYIIQELGKLHVNSFCYDIGKKFNWKQMINFSRTYNHSPLRNYYYVRNSLYYIHTYKKYINVKEEKKRLVKWEIKKLILEPHRFENIKMIKKAVCDFTEYRNANTSLNSN